LQGLDPGQQLALRELGPALDLMSKLSEALFKVAGRLESDNTLFEVCERFIDRSTIFSERLADRIEQRFVRTSEYPPRLV
jgi:hypothetical protein